MNRYAGDPPVQDAHQAAAGSRTNRTRTFIGHILQISQSIRWTAQNGPVCRANSLISKWATTTLISTDSGQAAQVQATSKFNCQGATIDETHA
jgi:hypothetical protein